MKVASARAIRVLWGALDVLYIIWICYSALDADRIPYIDDFTSFLDLSASHGGPSVIAMGALVWLLQVSIPISAFLLLTSSHHARWLCYAQVPLRLVTVTPSISLLTVSYSIIGSPGAMAVVALLLISEAVKIWTMIVSGRNATEL